MSDRSFVRALRCATCGKPPTPDERKTVAQDMLLRGLRPEQIIKWTCTKHSPVGETAQKIDG